MSRVREEAASGGDLPGPRGRRVDDADSTKKEKGCHRRARPAGPARRRRHGKLAMDRLSAPQSRHGTAQPTGDLTDIVCASGSRLVHLVSSGPRLRGPPHTVRRNIALATPRWTPSPVSTDLSTAGAFPALDHSRPSSPGSVRTGVAPTVPVGLSWRVTLEGGERSTRDYPMGFVFHMRAAAPTGEKSGRRQ